MSINAIEKALWQASMDPVGAEGLREDADCCLGQFRIDEFERALTTSWDIRGQVDLGVHPKVLTAAPEIKNWICTMRAFPGVKAEVIACEAVPEWITGMGFAELKMVA